MGGRDTAGRRDTRLTGRRNRGRHEIKFGASARRYTDDTVIQYPGGFLDIELDADGTTFALTRRRTTRAIRDRFR